MQDVRWCRGAHANAICTGVHKDLVVVTEIDILTGLSASLAPPDFDIAVRINRSAFEEQLAHAETVGMKTVRIHATVRRIQRGVVIDRSR